jgi:sensor domain CHASE-containing protein
MGAMRIRGKVLCAIGFALLATALANFFVLKTLVFPTFLELEQQAAARDIQRIKEALNAEIEDVDKTLWDYSGWDDSYRYAKGGDKTYPETNLGVESLQTLRLDVVEIYNIKKAQLFSVVFDRKTGDVRQADWTLASLADGDALRSYADDADSIKGVMLTPERPVLVASRPIVKTSREGPAVGSFLFGRFVDDALLAGIRDRIKVEFSLTPVDKLSDPAAGAYRQLLESGVSIHTERSSDDRLLAYSLIGDLQERPILLVTARVKRDLSQMGERVLLASVGGVALTAVLVMAVLAILLQWLLLGPLVSLTRHIVDIQAEGTPSRRVALPRQDEIGILSREFDHMLARLAEARDRLLDHSYQSGVAHMASGVLHNLRNQLMPVNTRVERLRERLVEQPNKHADAAFGEFTSEDIDPDRRAKLAAYLRLAFDNLRETQTEAGGQLTLVLQDLLRVEDVLGELDRFSRVDAAIQPVAVADCVQEAVAMLPSFPDVDIEVDIDPEVHNQPPVSSARFVLKHVLQNLFVNAVEAVIAAERSIAKISVIACARTIDGLQYVDLQVRDNGIGIPSNLLASIFVRGFSTKKNGRRGAGLHWCATSISALSGKIYAESAGNDQGSTFHVLLRMAD